MNYKFSILRYYHDIVSEEFLNVGVVVYFPESHELSFKYTHRLSRVSKSFLDADIEYLKKLLQNIDYRLSDKAIEIKNHNLFSDKIEFKKIINKILPIEDMTLRFSDLLFGLSDEPKKTINYIFERYVGKYIDHSIRTSRSDEEIWKVFKQPLESKKILNKLSDHTIITKDYEHKFEHCWKNDIWHINEPISFDLKEGNSILEKANTWLGRATSLSEKKDFKLNILLGKPQNSKLNNSFMKAENILNKMPCEHEFIREDQAEEFADDLANKILLHEEN